MCTIANLYYKDFFQWNEGSHINQVEQAVQETGSKTYCIRKHETEIRKVYYKQPSCNKTKIIVHYSSKCFKMKIF